MAVPYGSNNRNGHGSDVWIGVSITCRSKELQIDLEHFDYNFEQ